MRTILLSLTALLIAANISLAQDKQHAYMGIKKCSMCHKGEAKGAIFEKWQTTAHAKAFVNLISPAALETYKKKMGKDGSPQTDPACLKCHITGFGITDTTIAAALVKEDGVTCEACHGPGADYGKMNIMKDKAAALTNGLTVDPKAGCVKCHNAESPNFKEFKLDEFWAKIAHARPKLLPAP
jgi:hypothetical protein